MEKIYPKKLSAGDEIRIIAPSRSLAIISEECKEIANNRFTELRFKLSLESTRKKKMNLFLQAYNPA